MLHHELSAKLKKIHLLRRIWIQKGQTDAELSFGQLPILEYIHHHPGCTQAEIAEHLCVTPASISTSTKRLQKSGLLTKITDPENLRCNRLSITEEGIIRCENNRAMINRIHDRMFLGIDAAELAAFESTLNKVLQNLAPDTDPNSVTPDDIAALIGEIRKNNELLKKQIQN
jgi:DNA-binding MarR family transcriptional regulator